MQKKTTRKTVYSVFFAKGLDAFDYLKAEGSIRGTLPSLGPRGLEIDVEADTQELVRSGPGLFTGSSERSFTVKGSGERFTFTVDHRIEFEGCDAAVAVDDQPDARSVRFKSSKNYINYDSEEQVTRHETQSCLDEKSPVVP